MPDIITVTTRPPDLQRRLEHFPAEFDQAREKATADALRYIHQQIPAYPPPPPNSKYIRTGNLGAGLGKTMGGQVMGQPSIWRVRNVGEGYEGEIGSSRPHYNVYVIGSKTQAWMHRGRWWIMKHVAEDTRAGVVKIWRDAMEKLANYLEGR